MDRGFGSFRGNAGFSNDRDRYSRDERRYDDFYDNRRSGGNNRNMNKSGARGNQGSWVSVLIFQMCRTDGGATMYLYLIKIFFHCISFQIFSNSLPGSKTVLGAS